METNMITEDNSASVTGSGGNMRFAVVITILATAMVCGIFVLERLHGGGIGRQQRSLAISGGNMRSFADGAIGTRTLAGHELRSRSGGAIG